MKVLSSKIELEEDEVLVLMDSGSTINVAKIKKHFPMYSKLVVPSTGSVSGETATTACGKKLVNRGESAESEESQTTKNSLFRFKIWMLSSRSLAFGSV